MAALDDNLTSSDLDDIITEIDTDGSGTVDFDGKLLFIFHTLQLLFTYTIIYHTFFLKMYLSLLTLHFCLLSEFMEMMTGD